jgi:NAD(P)-dependent dehydrogenase (short-subunit alcohol dehydrogenase family)
MFSTDSRVALVTGAAGGLGQAFAHTLAAQGHHLILTDRGPCDELLAQLRAKGAHAETLACDLGNPSAVQAFGERVLALAGRVDILVNNAAFMPIQPYESIEPGLWRQIMTVNVDAPFLLAQAFAPGMAQRGWGRIVNLASSTVWGPPPGFAAYAASKMGVIGLTRGLAAELGAKGVTVNAISPGLTRHPGSAAALPEAAFEHVRSRQFIPRTETPDDLVGALAFLASDASAFITGQVLNVDGGGFGF